MITLLTVRHFTAPVAAFPLYIAVIATLEVVLVAGRLGPPACAAAVASPPGSQQLHVEQGRLVDPEGAQHPAQPEKGGQADRHVQDLGVGEALGQPCEEGVVDADVVEREALGVLHGELLLGAVRVVAGQWSPTWR